ncbi:SRPBCC family protein [Gordonia sp. ABSL11-1]|uniref:SRPBCC family protein n=1 Tax=Gordonia sp. ABSL11-1 TaxID=3053924 RepID=UPI002573239C|nr:SRPBCC family protein [Gordonia sp. ABSL11-1]MDL9946525.1 SRPBCC family protein [Gordonia sp. ABSL11-1]
MNKATRRTDATPAQVWSVLSDGWLYGSWVVGSSRIRDVDPDWPQAGTRIHHSVGIWPVLLDDETVSLQSKAGLLELSAAAWPFGKARIVLTVEKEDEGTLVTMEEFVETAPLRWIPPIVQQTAMAPRLDECLRRLTMLAERHTA